MMSTGRYVKKWNFPVDENILDRYKEIIRGIRNVRAGMNVPNSKKSYSIRCM